MERIELHDGKGPKTIENPGPGIMAVKLMTEAGEELSRFTLTTKTRLTIDPVEREIADYIEIEK
jgi:hypothetical protein